MNKDQIIHLLKSVNYPGFTRDIISFGMVKNISLDDRNLTINLNITTAKDDVRKTIVADVRNVLEATKEFTDINIQVSDPPAEATSTAEAPAPLVNGDIKHIVAVASGKGGVGKSTVAANLAVAMAKKGYKTGLLDLDIYGPSLPIILGINTTPKITDEKKLIPVDVHELKAMSFGLISGNKAPTIWRGPLVSKMTQQFFRDVEWGNLDILILDLPPGTGDIHLTLTQHIQLSGAIIVTTPQDMALADVQKGADMFRKVNVPVYGVVENMSGLQIEGTVTNNAQIDLKGVGVINPDENGRFSLRMDLFKRGGGLKESKRLGVPFLGEIPISSEITTASDEGTPVVSAYPNSTSARCYHDLANHLEGFLS